ncbi:winged helix-turn-helix transcriptional regulator [Pirellulaceae bacterium SH449]
MPERTFRCGLEAALEVVGGKWKSLIIWYLERPKRFGELTRLVSGISEKMLIQQLRDLERDGVVARKDIDGFILSGMNVWHGPSTRWNEVFKCGIGSTRVTCFYFYSDQNAHCPNS